MFIHMNLGGTESEGSGATPTIHGRQMLARHLCGEPPRHVEARTLLEPRAGFEPATFALPITNALCSSGRLRAPGGARTRNLLLTMKVHNQIVLPRREGPDVITCKSDTFDCPVLWRIQP